MRFKALNLHLDSRKSHREREGYFNVSVCPHSWQAVEKTLNLVFV